MPDTTNERRDKDTTTACMRRRKNQRWLCKGGGVGKEEDLRVSQAG
jgi:hypothetical protein